MVRRAELLTRRARIGSLAVALAVVLTAPPSLAAGAPPAPQTPERIVADIYTQLASRPQSSDDAYEGPPDSLFTPRLQVLAKASRRHAGDYEPCGLDYIFWSGNQQSDYEIANVDVQKLETAPAGAARVSATFTGHGTSHEIDFTFKLIAGRWRLDEAEQITADHHLLFSQALQCKG